MPLATTDDGVRLYWEADGDPSRPTVLLLPDWLGSSRFFDPVRPLLLAEAVRVLRWDPRGSGHSDRPEQGYGLRRDAEDAMAVARAAAEGPVYMAGHGYGALVAIAAATAHPRDIAGLVLLAPVAVTGAPGPFLQQDRRSILEDERGLVDFVAASCAVTVPVERLVATASDMARTTRAAGLAQWERLTDPVLAADTARVPGPVAVLAGELDAWIGRERFRLGLMTYLPTAHASVIPGVGHYLPLEAPEAVAAFVGLAVRGQLPPPWDTSAPAEPGPAPGGEDNPPQVRPESS